ncbi:elongation factor Ts [Candidatus Falkowbacteria bacterium]|jgi:elongation factor Ts|nr:translation elongation factor Ts [Patescibacteria group bacterium]MDD3435456.1 translation elongation factor Ts [Patescibacteria group bacterium]MDD4466388.1 translation elongation factor Ts [Patescibacteria group bacterium]NCU43208.1 elongation factor Ts [Candidatus Falkowbacteria bacterium]
MENIKKLREITGAGMVDCKKALDEAAGDLEKAVEILRKKGIAKAAKRIGREASEGLIAVKVNDQASEGYLVEVNSETDFVARNEKFQEFSQQVLDLIAKKQPENLETLLALDLNGLTVEDSLSQLSGVIGEKLAINRLAILKGASVAAYSHLGGRIGVLVSLDQPGKSELALDIAMQVAATNPKYINSQEVSSEELEKESEIAREILVKEGKPTEMIDKILEGKMGKYYTEVCLVEQEYIKDDKKKIKDILGDSQVLGFVRFSL